MIKYIDIHTHQNHQDDNIFSIQSHFIGEDSSGFFTVGVHPWQLEKLKNNWKEELNISLGLKNCLGLGECGLDRAIEISFERQKNILEEQLELYGSFEKKIVMLHIVKAYSDIIPYLKKYSNKHFIFHDYNGTPEVTKELLKFSCSFSYGKKLFKEKTKAMKSIELIPLEKLFCETDENDFSIQDAYKKLAEIKKQDLENIKKVFDQNLKSLLMGFPSI